MIPSSGPIGSFWTTALTAGERLDRLVRGQRRALVGEVAEDVAAEVRLAGGLGQRLAHLLGRERSELVLALDEQLADALDDLGTLLDRDVAPRDVRGVGGGEGGLDLGVGRGVEGLEHLTGRRVDALVGRRSGSHEAIVPQRVKTGSSRPIGGP